MAESNSKKIAKKPKMPLFSIITVIYNGEALLPGTIQSVQQQTFTDYEHLLVDGASKDDTLNIIQQYASESPRVRWISEPDAGLYDAMNKGQKMAEGRYILFLNAGDHLHNNSTLQSIAENIQEDTDVIYGETLLVNDEREPQGTMSELSTRKLPESLHWRQYRNGMLVVHQSFMPRRTLCPEYRLDNLCADYDWCIQILQKSRNNTRMDFIIANYLMGGVSKQRHQQSLKDRFKVMRKHFGLFPSLISHAYIVLRAVKHRLQKRGKKRY